MGWSTLFALVAAAGIQAPEPVPIPSAPGHIDGELSEWSAGPIATIRSDSAEFVGPGPITERTFAVWIYLSWTENGLNFGARWEDDAWDTRPIARTESTWTTPTGDRADRMYLYDHLGIQLRRPDRVYTFWLAPRADGGPLQWARLRVDRSEPAPEFVGRHANVAAARVAESLATLEVTIPWQAIEWTPRPGDEAEVVLIGVDSDCPGETEATKFARCLKYASTTTPVRFEP